MTEKAVILGFSMNSVRSLEANAKSTELRLQLDGHLNVLYGLNGSGKTITLETLRSALLPATAQEAGRDSAVYVGEATIEIQIADLPLETRVSGAQSFGTRLSQAIDKAIGGEAREAEFRSAYDFSGEKKAETKSDHPRRETVERWICHSIRNWPILEFFRVFIQGDHPSEGLTASARESLSRLRAISREISLQRRFKIAISPNGLSVLIAFSVNEATPVLRSEIINAIPLWPTACRLVNEAEESEMSFAEFEAARSLIFGEFHRLADLSFVTGQAVRHSDIEEDSQILEEYLIESERHAQTGSPLSDGGEMAVGWGLGAKISDWSLKNNPLFSIIGADDFDFNSLTRVVLQSAIDQVVFVGEDENSIRPRVAEARLLESLALGTRASELFAMFIPDAPSLVVGVPTPDDLLAGSSHFWKASYRDGGALSISQLSAASSRIARIAISLSVVERSNPDGLILLLIDEPEMGLHREAERMFLSALAHLAEKSNMLVVVTSHSPLALSVPNARLQHVARNSDGTVAVRSMTTPDRENLKSFGLSSADLLSLVRLFLVVEGHHDELILDGLLGDCEGGFKESGIHILPMHGGRHATSVVNRNLIWDFSDAPIALLLDRVPGEALATVWTEALHQFSLGDMKPSDVSKWFRENAPTALEGSIKGKGRADEVAWIVALGSRALESGNPERLTLLGLEADDILAYLPAGSLGEGTWLEAKRRGLSDEEIQNAVRKMEPIHSDLIHVLDACRGLTQGGAHS